MKAPLQLKIVLPEAAIPARSIIGIDVPATDGRMTILAGHQSVIVALMPGTAIVTTTDGRRERWQISDGALQMADNTAILLVKTAVLEH